jgi:hypothetical protein
MPILRGNDIRLSSHFVEFSRALFTLSETSRIAIVVTAAELASGMFETNVVNCFAVTQTVSRGGPALAGAVPSR